LKYGPHSVGFVAVADQPSATRVDVVPEHRVAPSPFALAAQRRHLVALPLTDNLSLELRER
jgi:hypothetical protein